MILEKFNFGFEIFKSKKRLYLSEIQYYKKLNTKLIFLNMSN